jgi:3-phytase
MDFDMKYFSSTIAIILLVSSCSPFLRSHGDRKGSQEMGIPGLTADVETTPVNSRDDAADDICIWYNEADPIESRVIGTNKKSGLVVYDLSGVEQAKYEVGRVNNVDIRYSFPMGVDTIDLIGATNRTYNSISLFKIAIDGQLQIISLDEIVSATDEVYGFCFYRPISSGNLFAILVSKSGLVEQYHLIGSTGKIRAELVRTLNIGSQCEGMVADDELDYLYVGEEDHGIWKVNLCEDSDNEKKLIADLSNTQLSADIEGLTLYMARGNKGYLIASSQGNNSYAIFNREATNEYIGSFSIVAGKVDGVSETDGIDIINLGLGDLFPSGLFIAQDGDNRDQNSRQNQNFKFVSWGSIASSFSPSLIIDSTYDFR